MSNSGKTVKGKSKSNKPRRVVLCGANAYEKKYYLNEEFSKLPQAIKDELNIICVLFTEEVGGVFTINFDEEGEVYLETNANEEDFYYDEISSGLLIRKIQNTRQELFESLKLYYRFIVKGESVEELLKEGEEE